MSVEMTTPQARAASPLGFTSRKIAAGTARPAIAATTGTIARERSVSSPIVNSRLTSRPTVKKKSVMRPSLTKSWKLSSRLAPATPTSIVDDQNPA